MMLICANAKSDAIVVHTAPMKREVEVDRTLVDDISRSGIQGHLEMGVAERMAATEFLARNLRAKKKEALS